MQLAFAVNFDEPSEVTELKPFNQVTCVRHGVANDGAFRSLNYGIDIVSTLSFFRTRSVKSAVSAAASDFGSGNACLGNDGRLKQRYEASVDVASQTKDVVASPVARTTEGGQPASVDTHFRQTRTSVHEELFANVDDLLLVGTGNLSEESVNHGH